VKTNKCFSLIHSIYVFIFIGLHFDCRLNWKKHIDRKRKHSNLKAKEITWLIGKKSHLSMENKLLIYKAVIKPIWSYRIELWDGASKSNSHHAEIPIQNSHSHSKCTLVCNKSYAPHKLQHPLRK
jgi:hypothetical protein